MLLIMAIALMIISAYIEFKIIAKCKPIRWLNNKSWAAGFIMSMGLSLTLGWLFGLSGLVAGMAGIGSTALTDPVHAVNRRKSNDIAFARQVEEITATYKPLLTVAKFALLLPLVLLMLPVKVRRQYVSITSSSQQPAIDVSSTVVS